MINSKTINKITKITAASICAFALALSGLVAFTSAESRAAGLTNDEIAALEQGVDFSLDGYDFRAPYPGWTKDSGAADFFTGGLENSKYGDVKFASAQNLTYGMSLSVASMAEDNADISFDRLKASESRLDGSSCDDAVSLEDVSYELCTRSTATVEEDADTKIGIASKTIAGKSFIFIVTMTPHLAPDTSLPVKLSETNYVQAKISSDYLVKLANSLKSPNKVLAPAQNKVANNSNKIASESSSNNLAGEKDIIPDDYYVSFSATDIVSAPPVQAPNLTDGAPAFKFSEPVLTDGLPHSWLYDTVRNGLD
ncbi:MAG: hypothetical protein LBB07_00620, partial [Bifidobacteriaceae bacterium]|nr:hypothetical protein [Bifidobacteriaceae bacterium]